MLASPLQTVHRCLSVPRRPVRCFVAGSDMRHARPGLGVRTHVATVERTNPVTQPPPVAPVAGSQPGQEGDVRSVAQVHVLSIILFGV